MATCTTDACALGKEPRCGLTQPNASLVPSPNTSPARIACSIRAGKVGLDVWLRATRKLHLECGAANFL